jgi:hypothetical protein
MQNSGVEWIHAELARWWIAELAADSEQPPWTRSSSAGARFDLDRILALSVYGREYVRGWIADGGSGRTVGSI